MGFFWECLIGTLAAVGLICILKTVYDIIMTGYYTTGGRVELFLYGEGSAPENERLLCAAEQVKRLYLPTAAITFIDLGVQQSEVLEALAARRGVTYIKDDRKIGHAGIYR